MVHIQNVAHIHNYGITHKNSPNANKQYQAIGDNSLINTRSEYLLENGKELGAYIPFYFGKRTPMLYVIQNGFNGVIAVDPENIVYCVSSIGKILESKIDFVYTDGHANDGFTKLFLPIDIDEIESQVDFKATNARYWKEENDLDFKRRKEAELLLAEDLPNQFIIGYIVYNLNSKQVLVGLGIAEKLIHIDPKYYF